jgi:thiosulfate reductase cytochrome b subunit
MARAKRQIERITILRHPAWLRLTHWINAICVIGLFMSGLQIFNAHPALYFGKASDFKSPVLAIGTNETEDSQTGGLVINGKSFNTTGLIGLSAGPQGNEARAFPRWITVPADQDLATGRHYHFLFAWILVLNGVAYLIFGVASGHLRRDLWPKIMDFARLPHDLYNHLRLRFSHGENAAEYNVPQKFTYAAIVFLAFPLIVLTGLTMSPGIDTALPPLPQLFGGRQSARSIHFILAFSLLLFFIIHVAMVFLAGPINEMRSMITGRFVIEKDRIS